MGRWELGPHPPPNGFMQGLSHHRACSCYEKIPVLGGRGAEKILYGLLWSTVKKCDEWIAWGIATRLETVIAN